MYRENSPLSKLLQDDSLTIMEQLLPCCPPPLAKIIALRMKALEIQKIMEGFNDEPYLKACGFENSSSDAESVLRSIRDSVSEEKAKQIDALLQTLSTFRLFSQWQGLFRSHPELMQLFSQSISATEKEAGDCSDTYADPSVFLLLNSLMNSEDSNADTLKALLELVKRQ
ncbi:MAG: hypothetical protein Q4D60_04950 [Eubacteriales bacterium]|nr:hypothetical protein [Eubacteriales bacterium]